MAEAGGIPGFLLLKVNIATSGKFVRLIEDAKTPSQMWCPEGVLT